MNLGRLHEAHERIVQVGNAITVAPSGSVEYRAILTFQATKSLYHLRKNEFGAAWVSVQETAEALSNLHCVIYTYIFAYLGCLEVVVSLVSLLFSL